MQKEMEMQKQMQIRIQIEMQKQFEIVTRQVPILVPAVATDPGLSKQTHFIWLIEPSW